MSSIAADTSSLVAFLAGETGPDVERIDAALGAEELKLPPPVLSELLSKPRRTQIESALLRVPLIDLTEGFWKRAGETRAALLAKGYKAAMSDVLIAQACIDADVPLIVRDSDYRHFAQWCGLKLAV